MKEMHKVRPKGVPDVKLSYLQDRSSFQDVSVCLPQSTHPCFGPQLLEFYYYSRTELPPPVSLFFLTVWRSGSYHLAQCPNHHMLAFPVWPAPVLKLGDHCTTLHIKLDVRYGPGAHHT